MDAAAVQRKLDRHLIPWLFSLGVLCYLDRTNLSFAALELNRDLRWVGKLENCHESAGGAVRTGDCQLLDWAFTPNRSHAPSLPPQPELRDVWTGRIAVLRVVCGVPDVRAVLLCVF